MSVERRGTKALEIWAKRATQGYKGVSVDNMTTSWRDGLAFCALIHHFKPDLIDFDSLKAENILENNSLAYLVAEQQLGIPALLDAEDMLESPVPDRLSILTYVSQFYQAFASQGLVGPGGKTVSPTPDKKNSSTISTPPSSKDNSPSPTPAAKTPVSNVAKVAPPPTITTSLKAKPISNPPATLQTKREEFKTDKVSLGIRGRREECQVCQKQVFLAERILVGSPVHIRHRTCFRCARCSAQLTLANYYETEKGEFCCETCPDEEKSLILADESIDKINSTSDSSSDTESDSSISSSSLNKSSLSTSHSSFPPDTEPPDAKKSKDVNMDPLPRTIFLQKTLSSENMSDSSTKPDKLEKSGTEQILQSANTPQVYDSVSILKKDENDGGSSLSTESGTREKDPSLLSHFDEAEGKENIPPVKVTCESPALDRSPKSSRISSSSKPTDDSKLKQGSTPLKYSLKNAEHDAESDIICDIKENSGATDPSISESSLKTQNVTLCSDKNNHRNNEVPISQDENKKLQKSNSDLPKSLDSTISDNKSTTQHPQLSKDRTSAINLLESRLREKATIEKTNKREAEETVSPFGVVLKKTEVSESSKQIDKKSNFSTKEEECTTNMPSSNVPDEKKQDLINTFFTSKVEIKDIIKKKEPTPPIDTDTNIEEPEDEKISVKDESNAPLQDEQILPQKDSSHAGNIEPPDNNQTRNIELDKKQSFMPSHAGIQPEMKSSKIEDEKIEDKEPPISTESSDIYPKSKASSEINNQVENAEKIEVVKPENVSIEQKDKVMSKDALDSPTYPEELNPFDDESGDEPVSITNIVDPTPIISTPPPKAPRSFTYDEDKTNNEVEKKPTPQIQSDNSLNLTPAKGTEPNTNREENKIPTVSLNPFDSDSEEEKQEVAKPPRKSTNPFWSDEEEGAVFTITPQKAKAKPPPRPPPPKRQESAKKLIIPSAEAMTPPSPTPSNKSSSSDVRIKKKLKPAPAPPLSSQPYKESFESDEVLSSKTQKDMKNQTNKLISDSAATRSTGFSISKSKAGEWPRKKGPAPPLPIPQKRAIHKLPLRKVQQELQDIEIQQTELERQGVLLETAIRERTELKMAEDSNTSLSISEDGEKNSQSLTSNSSQGSIEIEDMILQLFELVNEKNELFRRQTELMYIKREKRLEEEHAELEYQIRCLMMKHPDERTAGDKLLEEELVARLCKVVDQRDEIINCLELERQREAVENESIASHMIRYQEKYIEGIESSEDSEVKKKKKKKLKLIKKKKKKKDKEKEKSSKVDADKDVDETEIKPQKTKKKNWFKKPPSFSP